MAVLLFTDEADFSPFEQSTNKISSTGLTVTLGNFTNGHKVTVWCAIF
jgi:hypothetical protein